MEIAPVEKTDYFALSKLLSYDAAERGLRFPAALSEKWIFAVERGDLSVFTVKEGSVLVGYGCFSMGFDYGSLERAATLDGWYLLPDFRGKGYGKAMLEFLENAAKTLGARTLFVRPAEGTLFSSLGFTYGAEPFAKKQL